MQAGHGVTVSIVSHGQWAMVQPLLRDLARHTLPWVERVVLTVNVPEAIGEAPPGLPLVVVRNDAPRGFGANHNAAFARHAHTPWFLVLNPDIRLDRDVLAPLLAAAQPRSGLLAPRVREPDKAECEPERDLPTPLELLRRRLPSHRPPARAAWVPGMFMLLRREAYEQVGGFDERYFMYCEDVDLCARLQLAGWELRLCDGVQVLHEAQRDSHRSLRALGWHMTGLLKLWTSPAFWRCAASRPA